MQRSIWYTTAWTHDVIGYPMRPALAGPSWSTLWHTRSLAADLMLEHLRASALYQLGHAAYIGSRLLIDAL